MTKCAPPLKPGFRKCISVCSSGFVPNQGANHLSWFWWVMGFFPMQTARSTAEEMGFVCGEF